MNLTKNQQITLKSTDLNNLGGGVGKSDDGMTICLKGAVTGDTVTAKIIKVAPT